MRSGILDLDHSMSLLTQYPQLLDVQKLSCKRKVPVYLVGGFCRDTLLGKHVTDFDFAVERDALDFAKRFSRQVHGAFVLLDAEHGCARVVKRRADGEIETFDFADFRGKTIASDLRQRDFTLNTLACRIDSLDEKADLKTCLLDTEGGLKDLKVRRIRMAASKAFEDDPLRLLRAFSLQAEFGFKIEPKTLKRIKKDRDLIRGVSYERIRDEMFKIFESPRAAANIIQMDKLGLLEQVIPQVSIMYRVRQGAFHHLDVWGHTLETLRKFETLVEGEPFALEMRAYLEEKIGGERSRLSLLKLAAILHDVGKPQTYRKEGKKISFHGHEHVGGEAAKVVAGLLKLSTHERRALETMVRWHLRPGYLSNFKRPSARAVFRYFRDTKGEGPGIALFSIADQRATKGPLSTKKKLMHHEKICRGLMKEYFAKKEEAPKVRLLTGDDLIRTLKLKPSPLFAVILREVEEFQAAGKVGDKAAALELAKRIVAREQKRKPKNQIINFKQ